MRVEKTVFISYRRTNIFHARAIFQDLRANGYDAFLDFESIDAGSFEQIILNQVRARAHFLVILTPSALERCADPKDWLRREIETALDSKRNIVPLMFEGFDWKDVDQYLTGKLSLLKGYNSLRIPSDFFDEAMARLRTRFLNLPLDVILHPAPSADAPAVQRAIAKEAAQPKVEESQLSASEYSERGYKALIGGNYDAAIRDCTEALRLNPKDKTAYYNRGKAYIDSGRDCDGGIADNTEALRLDPQYVLAYINRAAAYLSKGDDDRAIADSNEALRLDPQSALAYNNRAAAYLSKREYDRAIADSSEALRLNPQLGYAYYNRGESYRMKGDYQRAIADCDTALRLTPNYRNALGTRGAAYRALKQYDKALGDLDAALQIDPNYQWVKDQRERVLRERG